MLINLRFILNITQVSGLLMYCFEKGEIYCVINNAIEIQILQLYLFTVLKYYASVKTYCYLERNSMGLANNKTEQL